jgi:hypothetical protein
MPGVFKKLNAQDVKITSFEAHKQYSSTTLSSIGATVDFVYWSPYNKSYFTNGNSKFYQIDKLYYRNYIQDRANRLELDSATYTTQERRLYEKSTVISLPQKTFGTGVQPGSFFVSCSYSSSGEQFNIRDDSFGNLYDVSIGNENFPNEDNRVFYLSPVNSYRRKNLNIDPETGNEYVNPKFPLGYDNTVIDDSYLQNTVIYRNIEFTTGSGDVVGVNIGGNNTSHLSNFTGFRPFTDTASIKIPHQPYLNFNKDESFTISFYYNPSAKDISNATSSQDYYLFSKEGTKTVPPSVPGTSLSKEGSNQKTIAPAGPKIPYRVFYRGNHPSANTASLFFERSDGDRKQTISTQFFSSDSNEINHPRFVSITVDSEDKDVTIKVENVKNTASPTLTYKTVSNTLSSGQLGRNLSNKADIYFYNKSNYDGGNNPLLTNNPGKGAGEISQFMIWNKALSSTELSNVSESIVGTPNVGNLFYDNGFAVITHPRYEDLLRNYDIKSVKFNSSLVVGSDVGNDPTGLQFNKDGTKLYITDNDNDVVGEYNLSTPFDLTSASHVKNHSGNGITTNPTSLIFNDDGSKAYMGFITNKEVREFNLSSSYDLGSRTLLDPSVGFDFSPQGIQFNNDGSKFYIADSGNGMIKQFKTSTPFSIKDLKIENDISSSRDTSNITSVSGHVRVGPFDVAFSEDGYKMFTVGRDGNLRGTIDYYKLKNAFKINTAAFINSQSLSNPPINATLPHGITFNNEGNKAYIVDLKGSNDSNIQEFSLPSDIITFKYKNTHPITENEYQCTVKENEFEFTRNVTARENNTEEGENVSSFVTGSNFKPYVTTIGLYDNNGNLLVVGKLGQPIKVSSETDTTFVIRFDT